MNNKCCIVIPSYKEELDGNDKLSFDRCVKIFGGKRPIKVVMPDNISTEFYDTYKDVVELVKVNPQWMDSVASYNRMCCSKEFYEIFKGYEYILVYQTDCWVFEDKLDYFIEMGYDWYGAPWPMTNKYVNMKKNDVGNGGLSIRKVSKMFDITSKHEYNPNSYFKNEDIFFCKLCGNEMSICPWKIAVNFSLETISIELLHEIKTIPMGLHGKHLTSIWDDDGNKLIKVKKEVLKKMISIVTINLNNASGLEKTIESVIHQTYFNKIEYIIIDGGSTDGSLDVIEKYKDKIDFYISEKDNGLYNAMNKGISHCNGEYVLFLNSGDKLFSDYSIYNVYDKLDCDIVYGDLNVCGNNGTNYIKQYPNHITKRYMWQDSLPHPSTFIRLKLFNNNNYDESYKIISDWIFFYNEIIRFGASYKHIDNVVSTFYLGGVSSDAETVKKERTAFLTSLDKKPRITIIMTCYNYSRYITEAIDSVIKSTYKSWRCIIVNDGSIDDSEKVILDKIGKDDRFTYIRQTNKGLAYSRNQGIRASESEYILNLDADDKISDTYLEKGIKYLDEHKDCSIYYGKAKMFYDDGTEEDWNLSKFDYKLLLVSNHVYSSFIFRKEEFEEVGGYDETMDAYEDWEFLVRFMRGKKAYMTDDVVFYYRRHRGSMDSSSKKDIDMYREYILYKNFKTVKEDLEKWKLEVEKSTD